MPYAEVDLAAARSARHGVGAAAEQALRPGEVAHRLYNRYLDELEYGESARLRRGLGERAPPDRLRPDAFADRHRLGFGQKNFQVKIAILGSALPLRSHPMTVAEEHAMIDVISGGRLISGFVRGIGAEYHTFGVNPTFSHDRFHEAHDLIVRAWTEPGPVRVPGQALQRAVREPVAAAAAEAAPADLDPVAGQQGDDRLGRAPGPALHLPADLQPGEGGGALPQDVPRHLRRATATRPRTPSSAGPFRFTSGTRMKEREGKQSSFREFPQCLRADAPRDAAAAGLHLARVAEERDEGQGADVRRRHPRAGARAGPVRLRQPGHRPEMRSRITGRKCASATCW